MPIPILPVNIRPLVKDERTFDPTDYFRVDISNLPTSTGKKSTLSELQKVSSSEASLLFKLWKETGVGPDEKNVNIPSSIDNNEILRLKSVGLISGDTGTFNMTQRGKDVILTMVLGEKNSLEKTSSKSFEEIVSEMRKKSSGGSRLSVGKPKK